jgi:hypothetical protein
MDGGPARAGKMSIETAVSDFLKQQWLALAGLLGVAQL